MSRSITRLLSSAAALLLATSFVPNLNAQTRTERLQGHLYFLASDSLQGRKAGTEMSVKASQYILEEYERIGLKPFSPEGWRMPFTNPAASGTTFCNVVGIIEGNDPVLKNEYIVLGAHFDHLGVKGNGVVYNGADDNASGSSALIEIARELQKNKGSLKRSIIIAAFDGEEIGLYGSYALSAYLKEKGLLRQVKLMASIDMVGWYGQSGYLKMEGVGTIKNGKKDLKQLAEKHDITLKYKKYEDEIMTATDTQGFAENGVATLAITTGLKSPYHKPGDDADLIDYNGLDKICGFLSDMANDYATDESFAPSGKLASKHRYQRFRLGLTAGLGTGSINFQDAAFQTRAAFSYEGGLSAWLDFNKHWALKVDGLYERSRSQFPVESNLYGAKGKYCQSSVCVPAYLILQVVQSSSRSYLGLGGFYRNVFDSEYNDKVTTAYPTEKNQYGIAFTMGLTAGYLDFSFNFRNDLRTMFPESDMKGKMSVFSFRVTRWF